jgi:septal ring factor EnvC (AmiA/AmiB activator)
MPKEEKRVFVNPLQGTWDRLKELEEENKRLERELEAAKSEADHWRKEAAKKRKSLV